MATLTQLPTSAYLAGSILGKKTYKTNAGETFTEIAPGQYSTGLPTETINSSVLAPQTEINYQTPAITPTSPITVPTLEPLPTEQKQESDLSKRLQELNLSLVGRTGFEQEQQKEFGLAEKRATQQSILSQLTGLKAQTEAIPLQLESAAAGRLITPQIASRQEAELTRQNAIKGLLLNAQYSAVSGDIATAQSNIENAVKAKFGPLEAEIQALTSNLNLIRTSPEYTRAEKKRAEQQLALQEQKKADLSKEKELFKGIQDIAVDAAKNGADAETLRNIQNATDIVEAQRIQTESGFIEPEKVSATSKVSGVSDQTTQTYADLLAQGKITLANVPQNIRNAVVLATGGAINKPLSDAAIEKVQQSESAVDNLAALKKTVESNLQFVGPISGVSRFNPWSKARQVQAEIDRVKQQVGKTLEGGVLRKEDEEKYKKILAQLSDTPETAIYKIDSMISSIERDIQTYKDLQQATGRFVPESGKDTPEDLRSKYTY